MAVVLELACALSLMVIRFTLGKKGYENVQEDYRIWEKTLLSIRQKAHRLIDEDGEAYREILAAFKNGDQGSIEQASIRGCDVPYRLYFLTKECQNIADKIKISGNKNLLSDARIATSLCHSIYPGCLENISCNLPGIHNPEKRKPFEALLKQVPVIPE